MSRFHRLFLLRLIQNVIRVMALYAVSASLLLSAGPREVSAQPALRDRLYVMAQDTLVVIDPLTLKIVKTVNVGGRMGAAALTADGKFLYVSNPEIHVVMVIDTATSQVIDLVRAGKNPGSPVVLSPDGKTMWVRSEDAVSVIEAASHKRLATIPAANAAAHVQGSTGASGGMAFAPVGKSWRVYVTNPKENTVTAIDAEKYAAVATIPVGREPRFGVVYSKLSGKVYVANPDSQDISVIDPSTNTVVKTIPLPLKGFAGIAITNDGKFLFLDSRHSRGGGDSQIVVDASTDSVVATIDIRPEGTSTPANPSRLVFTPDGRWGIAILKTSPNVVAIDIAALKIHKTITLKPLSDKVLYRCSVTLSPDGRTAYITSSVEQTITVIDVPTFTVRAIMKTNAPTCGMVYVQSPVRH